MIRAFSSTSLVFLPFATLVLATQCSPTAPGPGKAELRGQELFESHCALCHEFANPELRRQPPKLAGLFRLKALPSGAPATDDQVRKTIIEGLGTMPAFDQRLHRDEVDDIVQYLHTLK
jgi:mono/diheme cytochrome c family protein